MSALQVVSRSEWGAAAFKGQVKGLGKVREIVVHHAAGYRADNVKDGKRRILEIQKLHQGPTRKWADIGYHFLIDSGGTVYQGRPYLDEGAHLEDLPRLAVGAHVLNMNVGKVGICLLGCFHPPSPGCGDTPTESALQSLEALATFLCENYKVAADMIKTHRDYLNTDCPGDLLFAEVTQMRKRIAASAA
jgi:hypothetical protein